MNVLKNIMRDYKLSKNLFKRIRVQLKNGEENKQDDSKKLLDELPNNLKTQLSCIMHKDILKNIPFFKCK